MSQSRFASRYRSAIPAIRGAIGRREPGTRQFPGKGRSSPATRPRKNKGAGGGENVWGSTFSKLMEGCGTALGSILVLGLAGWSYHYYYKSLVLSKLENAFSPGYSSLERAALGRRVSSADDPPGASVNPEDDHDWVPRSEQSTIDAIVSGSTRGQYYLITGEKGTGKTSMLLKSMKKIGGDGVAMLEAHGDLEIFRVRLGKALDYEFHEDYIGGLFSIKGPRDTTPLLDIERAFNKMEKIALKRYAKVGKPLVLIVNGAHHIRDTEDGQHLLELIQQRAEMWATSHLVTVVFNSDEYWLTERLMGLATRMTVIPIRDIPRNEAIAALKRFRARAFHEDVPNSVLTQVYDNIGGRLRFLDQVGKSSDMQEACRKILEKEKRWFLSQCWIFGGDLDEEAEEQQDFCTAGIILAKALVERAAVNGCEDTLPRIPLHEARQLMTRADFIRQHDHLNIVTIDSEAMVQADSVAMQNVFKDICSQEGFSEHLQATIDRLDELESLGRTKEIIMKTPRE